MSWLNGRSVASAPETNGFARVNVLASTLAVEPVSKAPIVPEHNHSNAELARFMPVMDIEQAVARRNVIVDAMKQLMVEGVDYGKIPGCGDKPALLQPGADKLCNLFGLTLRYRFQEKVEDWTGADHGGEPFFYYQIAADVYRGEFLLAEGIGACHSWESKYRWRKGERTCPTCHQPNIRKSRDTGWYCWVKTGGCGATFSDGDPTVEKQEVGRKANPDVLDSVNTILKLAYKRAKLSGTINATSASEFFTQDIEDFTPPAEEPIDIGNNPRNSRAAQQYVAEQKISTGNLNPQGRIKWSFVEMAEAFQAMRKELGETLYLGELERYGWHRFQDIKNAIDSHPAGSREKAETRDKADACYRSMQTVARKEGK